MYKFFLHILQPLVSYHDVHYCHRLRNMMLAAQRAPGKCVNFPENHADHHEVAQLSRPVSRSVPMDFADIQVGVGPHSSQP